MTIHKMDILLARTREIEKTYYKNEKRFYKICDQIDDNYDMNAVTEKCAELNIIMAKSDELLEEIVKINELVAELKLELMN